MKKNLIKEKVIISKKVAVIITIAVVISIALIYLVLDVWKTGGIDSWVKYQKFPKYIQADIDVTGKPMEINSPEGIAQATARIYISFSRGEIKTADMFDRLLDYASTESLEVINQNPDYYRRKMIGFLSTMTESGDFIEKIEFATTVYNDENYAYIERIQYMHNGSRYYFRQDFVKENNIWKVRGDNITNPFKFK